MGICRSDDLRVRVVEAVLAGSHAGLLHYGFR